MPGTPPVEDLGDGVWSLPVPIPGNPLGFTYVYALTGGDGPVLIDTGWDHDDSWDALVAGLARIGHRVEEVRGAVLTHFHPDHTGLTGRLRASSDAWLAMHPADIAVTEHLLARDEDTRLRELADRTRAAGFPEDDIAELLAGPRHAPPPVVPDLALPDGARVDLPGRDLRAVWTPGHTPGHLCLHLADGGRLFTGDHVLPRITPHIGLFPPADGEGDPLGDYLSSQRAVGALPGADALLCLPAHEHRFTGPAARAAEIARHHEDRLGEIITLLRGHGPATLWEVSSGLAWRRPWTGMGVRSHHMAAAETAAHLRLAERRGLAARTGTRGLPRWVAVTAPNAPRIGSLATGPGADPGTTDE
ncbi:Glyoxylase, beta-lactamase superfamily II [Nocardiopsis flavescens]|uniref:Glyoxylase, beta-lactamase superfamily II n=1 Tax=Nocardiopsis flavescens TaxID=758803 RepID=A0A1M6UL24_9ACTN|nr:MBL fold metallo-hydrolase [Nocardiopsis flavescens]SHK69912.1 Glyoxylase, beta-lactamase superfamily II [Nocardiopsis flavescens]